LTGAVEPTTTGVFSWLGLTVQYAVLAFLYLNSAAHMTRLGIVKPERLRPTIRLT
jgi:hypothetical protein